MGVEVTPWAEFFAGLARDLRARGTVADTLDGICVQAVDVIEHCEDAGVSQTHRGQRIDTPAATSERVRHLHAVQYELNNGPCMEAAWDQHVVRIDDLTVDTRWPTFAGQAIPAGIRSMLCLELYTHKDTLGALNLFSTQPHAFDDTDRQLGQIFAAHAAIALDAAQTEASLTSAVQSRQHIGEAVGILAERHHLSTHDAFGMLVTASQHHNIPLRDIARRLVEAEDSGRTPRQPDNE